MKTAVVGLQWGDEGKGKVVDTLAEHYDTIVRFNGGPNAGHTIYFNDEKHVLHVIPSGIFSPGKHCLITGGVVLDLAKLVKEITGLQAKNVDCSKLRISPECHLILPYHILIDQIREGRKAKLGTTKSGIGPCYADKTARIGIRIKDLFSDELLKEALQINLEEKNPFIVSQGYLPLDAESLFDHLKSLRESVSPYIGEVRGMIADPSKECLFEGAQGAMLDIDHGTYPFVTSSQAGYAGLLAGSGLSAREQVNVIGVIKAYNTRVGTGPFPTEDKSEVGERIRTQGKEFGSTTGRPRRCGWLDIPQLKYAIGLSGADTLVMTKLDVLSGLPEIKVCVDYEDGGNLPDWEKAIPKYISLPGFTLPDLVKGWVDLPKAARDFVHTVQDLAGLPITHLSLGPRRNDMIPTI